MKELAEKMIDAVAANVVTETETEYIGEDGLLHCRTCGGFRETIVTPPFEGAQPRKIRCWCGCPTEFDKLRAQAERRQIDHRRHVCFRGVEEMTGWTFEKDDARGDPKLTEAAKRYAADFKKYRKDGMGLMYYGPVGTGKTFLACCIANALLDKGYRVKMTNFATVADEMWAAQDKAAYVDDLCTYDLVILDDLGVERKSEYMQEMVYKIVNARYVAGVPVIVTTNLTQDELTKTADVGYARTYDRLLEMCLPVKVEGRSRRRAGAAAAWGEMRKQLGMEG